MAANERFIPTRRGRPGMKDYGIAPENADTMLEWSWVADQMEQSRNYWIASVRADGRPHAAPVWGVWMDGAFYFGTGRKSVKARNFAHQPKVVIHLESGDDTVIFDGEVEEVTATDVLKRIADVYGKKYPFQPDPINEPESAYYVLVPSSVLAWKESDFPNTATRWTFGA